MDSQRMLTQWGNDNNGKGPGCSLYPRLYADRCPQTEEADEIGREDAALKGGSADDFE